MLIVKKPGGLAQGYHDITYGFYCTHSYMPPAMEALEDPDKPLNRTGYAHIAFSVGSKEEVDRLTERLKYDGFEVVSGPRITGDGYYESCIVVIEGNQIEITV